MLMIYSRYVAFISTAMACFPPAGTVASSEAERELPTCSFITWGVALEICVEVVIDGFAKASQT